MKAICACVLAASLLAPHPAAAQEKGPILIGVIGSLTGAEATYGLSTRHGVELAIAELNAKGGLKGRKFEAKVYDDQGKPEEAATATTRLVALDKVAIVLGEVA